MTRLTGTNYETQAAAATDLGGIEISRSRLVITIGLATITYNESATAIIIAAGDAKASIVREAVEEPRNPKNPASALQDLRHAQILSDKRCCESTDRTAIHRLLRAYRRSTKFTGMMSLSRLLSSREKDWMS